MKQHHPLVFCLSILAATMLVYAVVQFKLRIPAGGVISAVGLEVYSDVACIIPLTYIDWGFLAPGESKIVTCYLKSLSTAHASLSLTTGNRDPSQAANYIRVSWNREAALIKPGEVLSAELTLTVDSAVQGISNFNFTIIIAGVETWQA